MKVYFPEDHYDTPEHTPGFLMDKFFLNTRFTLYLKIAKQVLKNRRLALEGIYDDAAWAESSFKVFKDVESCGGQFHIRGLNHLHTCSKPIIFVSNHMSTLETFVLPSVIAPFMKVTFIVKESLVKHPFFGPIMRSRNPVVVKRSNPREDFKTVMVEGLSLLEKGCSIIIFPQSTRKTEFIPEEFNSLGVKLAKKAKVQIMPVAVKTDFWGNGKYLKDFGPVNRKLPIYMTFGEPLTVLDNEKEAHKKTVEFIQSHLYKWNENL